MAVTASLTITNNTAWQWKVGSIAQVDDDSSWSAPNAGSVISPNGGTINIAMGNGSAPFPKGCGCQGSFFVCGGDFDVPTFYLEIPAVGSHTFNYAANGNDITIQDNSDVSNNNYKLVVSPA